jgi:bifunctional DNA-binding transcriptional regulator/antitoxin component of YhaV-PrlF toxin-antitoxin module
MEYIEYVDLPKRLKEGFGFKSEDKFIAIKINESVLIKKIEFPRIKEEFKDLVSEVEKKFKEKNITKKDVEEAIEWSRAPIPMF